MSFSGLRLRKIFFALLLAGLAFFLYQHHQKIEERGKFRWFDRPLIFISSPIVGGIRFVGREVHQVFDHYFFLIGVQKENEILQQETEKLKASHMLARETEKENERLRQLLDLKPRLAGEWTVARVVSYPPVGPYRMITVDKGSEAGIERRAPVVATDGLVGQVVRVAAGYSQILLITDPTSAVDVRLDQNGARGLVVGKVMSLGLNHELFVGSFEYLNQSTDIEPGMQVLTSGMDGIYPAGIPVGTVISKKKKKYDVFQQAELVPAVDFYKAREVMILKK